jgi:diphthamide biosynthesis enzyme Dph1/Dph2-like protein
MRRGADPLFLSCSRCGSVAPRGPAPLLLLSHILTPYLQLDPTNDILVLADATYGAYCLTDRPTKALEPDILVHYDHSCLVPVTSSLLPMLYVFIEIHIAPSAMPSQT